MQVMSLAFNGFGILRNLRNLACRLCLWHFMGSKSSESSESCVQAVSLAFDGFGNLRK